MVRLSRYISELLLGFTVAVSAQTLLLQPLWAQAGDESVPISLELAKKGISLEDAIQDVKWDLEHLDEVLEWMDQMAYGAGSPLTMDVAKLVYETLNRSLQFIEGVIKDETLEQSVKLNALSEISASFGFIFHKIIRHHGQDRIDDRDLTAWERVLGIFQEFYFDIRALAPQRSISNQLRPGVVDRLRRDYLGHETVLLMQRYAKEVMPSFEDQRYAQFFEQKWTKDLLRSVRLRSERLGNQAITAATYFGIAFMSTQFPLFDVIGMLDGRSENSLFVSSMIYASVWVVIGSLKSMTISATLLEHLDNLKTLLKDPSAHIINPGRNFFQKVISPFRWWVSNWRARRAATARTQDQYLAGGAQMCRDLLLGF